MNDLIKKLAKGKPVSDRDIADELFEICDKEHASCNSQCPVYELNGGKAVNGHKPFEQNRGCDCFKNGMAMLDFIRSH